MQFSLIVHYDNSLRFDLFCCINIAQPSIHSTVLCSLSLNIAEMVDTRIAVLVAVAGGILLFSLGIPAWAALGVALTIGGWKYIRLVIRTVPRDLRYVAVATCNA